MRLLFSLKLFIIVIFVSPLSWAVSPEIAVQQKRLQFEQKNWNEINLPKGVEGVVRDEHNSRESGYDAVSLHGKNILLNYLDGIQFDVRTLNSFLRPTKEKTPVELNDITSFYIDINDGNILLSDETLEFLFNRHVLNYPERSLKNVSIKTDKDVIYIETDMRLNKPFPRHWLRAKMQGHVTLDDENRISINVDKLKTLGFPLGGPMKMLKLNLDQFVALDRPGISLSGRSIKINLDVLPKPKLNGTFSKLQLEKGGLRLSFSSPTPMQFDAPPYQADSYMWLQSGDLRIADMVILNGNMQAMSAAPGERLKFHLYNCRAQIARGSLKISADGEVIAYLPDTYK